MRIRKKDLANIRRFSQTQPRQLGDLHERALHLFACATRCGLSSFDNATWQALHDLLLEIAHYEPASPPFCARIIPPNLIQEVRAATARMLQRE